jgi:hypothetical protein
LHAALTTLHDLRLADVTLRLVNAPRRGFLPDEKQQQDKFASLVSGENSSLLVHLAFHNNTWKIEYTK